jgi:spermidine synthase
MKKLKNILSFLYPLKVETRKGSVTPYLEVIKSNGKFVLNSQNANYSFGGLNVIFDELFDEIKIKQYDIKNVLLLGMGAGNVISLLYEKYHLNCKITAIEKDEVVIELAKKYFNIEKFKHLTIEHADAFDYAKLTENKYDLIISDLFIDGDVPQIFASPEYLRNLHRIGNEQCCVIYNKMTESSFHKNEMFVLAKEFVKFFPTAEVRKLYANDSENSLLYSNTLLMNAQTINPQIVSNASDNKLDQSILKPAF